jgi:drug/metabolite transporter (DMT)-like permease
LAYFLWFLVIESLPAVTASLGTLLVPVIGVIGSALVIGERPGPDEIFGFALILAAAGSVLFQHDKKTADAVPPE